MKIIIITQARYGSSRLPGKVIRTIGNETMLGIHLKRLKRSKLANEIIVATTEEPEAINIINVAKEYQCLWYQGSLNDVLDRFYKAASQYKADIVVRVTSDCPLNDGLEIDNMLEDFLAHDQDYLSNTNPPTYPDGIDIEIFKFGALVKAWNESKEQREREHVTPFIWQNPGKFKLRNYPALKNNSEYRLTVDNSDDLELVTKLVVLLGSDRPWMDYLEELKKDKSLMSVNQHHIRNEKF